MFISRLRWRAASALITAGTAAATVLALAVPAGASTGATWISPEQAGYTATGAQFKWIDAYVYLRNPAQYAGMVARYRHSVQLRSSGLVVTVGVRASTSGTTYTPYATIYNRSTHQVIASNPHVQYCDPSHNCSPGMNPPLPFGTYSLLRLGYDQATGNLHMNVRRPLPGIDRYDEVFFSYGVGAQSFTQARVGTEFGRSPWDASYSYSPPTAPVKVAAYKYVMLWNYNNHYSTLWSWWVHHKLLADTGQLRVAVPTDLSNGGASFQTRFVPKSAQSSS